MIKKLTIFGFILLINTQFFMSYAQENNDINILFIDNFSNEGLTINDEVNWTGRYPLPDISAVIEDSVASVKAWRKVYTTPTFDHSESWIKYSAVIMNDETSSTVSTHPVINGNISTGFGVSVVFENSIATIYGNNLAYSSQRTELSYDLNDIEGDLHVEIFQNGLQYSVRLSKGYQFNEIATWTATRPELASNTTVFSLSSNSSISKYDNVLIEISNDPRFTELAWLFEENSGVIATDNTGEYIINIINADWGDGINGKALIFNDDDDYVDLSSISTQINYLSSSEGAIEIWAKIGESTKKQYLFHALDKSSNNEIELYYSETDQLRFVFHDWEHRILLTENVSGVSANDGIWHQFIISWDVESDMQLYIDGELAGSTIISDLQELQWTPDFDHVILGADATYLLSNGILVQELIGSIDNFSVLNSPIQPFQAQTRYTEKIENAILPIELLYFNVNLEQNIVSIDWATSSETNNDYFTIQRSIDCMNWEDVDEIPGSGNSAEMRYYQFIDNSPINGTSYYRLKQTDFDGASEIFDAKSINITIDKSLSLESINTDYASGIVEIQYKTQNSETVSISIYSTNGKLINTLTQLPISGINQVTVDVNEHGITILQISQSNQVISEKIFIR